MTGLDFFLPPEGALPAYVYDLAEVRRATTALLAQLPAGSRLLYSVKANPHPMVVRQLVELGCGLEVSSSGELAVAEAAGALPETIVYTGPGKTLSEVDAALEVGVRMFSVDSAYGLDVVLDRARRRRGAVECLIRVNEQARVGQGLGMSGGTSQFGIDTDLLMGCRGGSLTDQSAVAGLHYYLGTNLVSEEALIEQLCTAIASAEKVFSALGLPPRVLDLGGGFPAPFAKAGTLMSFSGLRTALTQALDNAFAGWSEQAPAILFESGRYLTAACGRLFTRVADVKRSGGRPVVVLESGINHLGGLSGLRRVPPIVPEIQVGDGTEQWWDDVLVVGPLCTPLDSWGRGQKMPAVRPGDVVSVPNVGAYGLTASLLSFLGHPVPVEIVVDGTTVADVSRIELVRHPMRSMSTVGRK